MTDTLTYLGSLSVGAACPGVAVPIAAVVAELQAKLDAQLALAISLGLNPPTLAADLVAVGELAVSLAASVAAGLPGVDFQVAANAAAIIELEAKLAVLAAIVSAFAQAGIEAFVYDGRTVGFGPAVSSAMGSGIGGGTGVDHCNALVLATRVSAAWTALGTVLVTA